MVCEQRMNLICIFMLLAELHDQGRIYLGVINTDMNKEKQSLDDYGFMKMTLRQLLMWKKLLVYNSA